MIIMKLIKSISFSIIAVMLALTAVLQASAETIYEYYGISYVILSNTELSVVGWDNRSEEFKIPAKINGRQIVSFGNGALMSNTFITSVDLTNAKNLNRIGAYAFQDCTGINTDLVLPKSVTVIENRAFQGCSSIPTVTINSAVTAIPNQCFKDCSSLVSAELPEGVERINAWAFAGCTSLEYVNIPESVTFISDYAFDGDQNVILGVNTDTAGQNYAAEKNIPYILLDGPKLGDANGDGMVDILDSTEIQKFAAESTVFTDEQFELADINDDGFVDVIDALLVQKYVVGEYDIPPIIYNS